MTKAPTKADTPSTNGGIDPSPATTPPDTSTPAPSTTSTPAPPSTPPAAGSCGAPKCVAGFGSCGCTATDGTGTKIQLGCQDGACACFSGFQQTTDAFDGDCADAKSAFFANCQCD